MTRKLLAIILGLSAWIAGTVAAAVVSAGGAVAQPTFVVERAHAGYVPSLEGDDPIFVLLMGSDSRPGTPLEGGLADSLHILGINPAAHRATLYGLPRDSFVPLSTGGTNKINAAMVAGGPEAEVQTVENVTGIQFDYYALTGFNEVTNAVEAVGGMVVDVPYTVIGYDQTFSEGLQRMDGRQVLEYARTRHSLPLGDFQRSLNQGVVMTSALSQFRAQYAKDASSLYQWLGAGLRNVQTTLPIDELIKFAGLAASVRASRVTNLVALGSSGMEGAQSVVYLSNENQALWEDLNADGYILQKDIPADAQPG